MRHLKSLLLSVFISATPVLAAPSEKTSHGPTLCDHPLLCCAQLQGTRFVCRPSWPLPVPIRYEDGPEGLCYAPAAQCAPRGQVYTNWSSKGPQLWHAADRKEAMLNLSAS